ncbi:MAG TPA: dihydropteroate synthase [Polyangia bacterium]|nr:dihydropteroate synthase [Polyangia bacterium]
MDRCLVVGVLNCTPDSFSDGGKYAGVEAAVDAGVAMAEAGADWIDVGGESTRPGSVAVGVDEELRRVLPVIEGLKRRVDGRTRISIDTYRGETARAAIGAGASVINDISGGLLEPAILGVAAETAATIVLGHLRGVPATMMESIAFGHIVDDVVGELMARVHAARAAGCGDVWADPGIGFGKRIEHNLALLGRLPELCDRLEVPVMMGVSRKAFIGQLTGRAAAERQFGTAAAVTACVLAGARAVRVHDVPQMVEVVKVAAAIRAASG